MAMMARMGTGSMSELHGGTDEVSVAPDVLNYCK